MADDKKYLIFAKTLGELESKLAKQRAKERKVIAAARARIAKRKNQ